MLLVDHQIRKFMSWGAIVIEPFVPSQLNNASYDLTLGPYFARYETQDAAIDLGRNSPEYTIAHAHARGVIELDSGERILGHSNEFVGGTLAYSPSRLANVAVNTQLQATSTAGRLGITACMCAGWGDVGFINRWTFEISNVSPNRVMLPVGSILAQIIFLEVEPPERLYPLGTYQTQQGLADVQRTWHPQMMLPKRLKGTDLWRELYT